MADMLLTALVMALRYARWQMIDKIWYDWQSRDPANAGSFFGGSVQNIESLDAYRRYPSGSPPYLSVSTRAVLANLVYIKRLILI